MKHSNLTRPQSYSAWPHLMALGMMCVTFPLIFVGGLVTTYDAGMAVPDWPNTYGYNMFAYPLRTWWQGPWDLFIEHGHRLLGTFAGIFAILFVVAVFRCDSRKWMRWLAFGGLALVIAQGMLGGIRVLAVDQEIAKIHGCVGPLFFSYTALLVVITSKRWLEIRTQLRPTEQDKTPPFQAYSKSGRRIFGIGLATFFFAYMQLFLGANLRHFSVEAPPTTFAMIVVLHLIFAFLVGVHAILLWGRCFRERRQHIRKAQQDSEASAAPMTKLSLRHFGRLYFASSVLLLLTLVQLLLGFGTWVVKYGIPNWVANLGIAADYVPIAKSMFQANVVTFHVATGSLILAITMGITIRGLVYSRAKSKQSQTLPFAGYGVSQ